TGDQEKDISDEVTEQQETSEKTDENEPESEHTAQNKYQLPSKSYSLAEEQMENTVTVEEKSKQQRSETNSQNEHESQIAINSNYQLASKFNILDCAHPEYIKSSSARERPTICTICYKDVRTHFGRHLFRHHMDNKEVALIKSLKPRSKERMNMIKSLRKQGYFHLNIEKNILNPVKSSKNPETVYFVCKFCLGHYGQKQLYKHVKKCQNKPSNENNGRHCLSESQTFAALMRSKNSEFLKSSRIKKEVFHIMRADSISETAKNDPLLCLYGESLLAKHKRQQIANVVSNKMREMGRILIELKKMFSNLKGIFEALKPEMFKHFVSAAKIISGYDEESKSYRSPSLALHMGTNLKFLCDVGYKVVLEGRTISNVSYDKEQKRNEIKDLRKLIQAHWCNEISSIALKTLKERNWKKPIQLPLSNDIQKLQEHLKLLSEQAYTDLTNNINITSNYRKLLESVFVTTVLFNRKRVGDVQYLTVEEYKKDYSTVNQESFVESLSNVEKIISKKFKRIVTGGKGSKAVPILLSPETQKYTTKLLEIREDNGLIPLTNPYLFANPHSKNRWISGVNVIRKLAKSSGAQNPELLSSTKFRKHIATTLQLMTMDDNELEQVATFMGHTKKTHTEFYRLPQDIYQTAKVAKVLMILERGKGKELKGKSLDEINFDEINLDEIVEEENLNSDFEENDEELAVNDTCNEDNDGLESDNVIVHKKEDRESKNENTIKSTTKNEATNVTSIKTKKEKKSNAGRERWSKAEKSLVCDYFKDHIQKKIAPKTGECAECIPKYKDFPKNKDWLKIKTLVYNTFRAK
uniref:Uncharacterized protein LOC114347491 n=1 Tax=Diabrotica virgifera virgifera TaxID=50390 RepID=A0A6P7GWY7_DIAVI